jgi:DNA repair photolyase
MILIKEIAVKDIVTKSKLPDADYVINPYVGCPHKCIYCYAEFMKRFTNHAEPWGDFLDVKRYTKEIKTKALSGKSVLISSVTDAYNPYEAKYNVTRQILKELENSDGRVEILTKSKLVLRDLDIIKNFKNIRIGISLNTLDDAFRKKTEPLASPIKDRLETLKVLKAEGINSYIFVSPIFPEITDIDSIIEKAADVTDMICFENLNLRGGYKEKVLKFIGSYKPTVSDVYRDIFVNNNTNYWVEMENTIREKCNDKNIPYKIYFYHEKIKKK